MKQLSEVIFEIPKQPQTQESLTYQLLQLQVAANRLGLYDAADFLQRHNNQVVPDSDS